ncbi:ubiquitin carboxyl-terminal hydrolase 31-like [Sinocyclocheilus rhinocerous]|uniref:ubiquitin carboxyl-terminal hydrolase 31-like n=1 Tax=Sinocyclocheilus rhinocerous TaxID=307959 RepID=UPI0007B857AE|nr:PREDICTED: ubiquitin carboxyl-terminal hydrolase 31-like [Sinocyclocheilus rhinocerous]
MSSKSSGKEKKSGFSKKLFRRGSVRSVGSFMSRVLKTLSTLSHFGSELHAPEGDKDDGGFTALKNEGKGSVASDDSDCGGFLPRDKIPGVAGLKNHGNTCFMNAILQCLSNTELFAEYLALEQYRGDQTDDEKPKTNGVVQRKGGQDGGEVTEQLSGLVRALWTFEYTPQHSRDFKNAVAKSAMQYRGNAQHDAQEFLLWLLDRVHEDLNHRVHPNIRASIKPPIEEDDGALEGPSPPLSAGSFVQELFQAQYRSSLTCPHCQKQSNTFDPFLCISLPIPLPHTRGISLPARQGSLLANLNQNNVKYGVESGRTPSFMQGAMNPVSPNKNTGCEKMILLICNRACTGHQGRRFGLPFVLYLERTVTWDVLQKEILEKMRHLLRPGVYVQVGPFSLRVVGVVGITYLLPQEEQPLCHPTVERAYKSCGPGGPPHVKIVVEWDKETKEYLFGHTEEEYIPDAESVYRWPQMMLGAAPIVTPKRSRTLFWICVIVSGSTSSSLCEHWVNRLQGSRPPSLASGASSRRTSLISLAESVEFPGDRSEDDALALTNTGSPALLRGFSTRPFVRSIQRQSLSSRSSVTSPLVFSENGMKPSWSLSQKLQMRSNSPSRFSLDSRSSPPLERIGEACDDKVSTSCFGGYSRHERQPSSKAPLAMMEGNGSDDGNGKQILDEAYCRAPTQSDRKSSKGEPIDNNNQINAVDQNALGALSKEQKHKSSVLEKKAEGSASKKSSTKTKGDQEKPSKKRQSTSSVTKSPSSQVSSSPQAKGSKATNLKEKSNSPKSTKGTPSGTPSKRKESLQAQESPVSGGTKGKPSLTSTPQSSASPSPTSKKSSSVAERNSVSGKKKLVERGSSKDLAHTSPLAEKSKVSATPQTSQPKTTEASRPERRPVRSSSSSSSVTSLRSPSVSSRDLRRCSKSEDKGLSFFKSALRQKETRRSADLGKTTILAKKAVERTAKSSSQCKLDADEGEGSGNSSQQVSPEPRSCKAATDEKESSKTSTPNKRSLLQVGKSKSSNSEASLQSPINGKRPLEKISSSKKLSSSMQSSARPTQTPQ